MVRNDVLDVQLAHRSVRTFAPGEVSEDQLRALVAAAQSAPTSSNLQPWSVVAVRDPERKARLPPSRPASSSRRPSSWCGSPTWAGLVGCAGRSGVAVDADDHLETTIIGLRRRLARRPERRGRGGVARARQRVRRCDPQPPHEVAAELGPTAPRRGHLRSRGRRARPDRERRREAAPAPGRVLHHEQYDAAGGRRPHRGVRRPTGGVQRTARAHRRVERAGAERLAGPESMAGRHVLRDALEELGLPSR